MLIRPNLSASDNRRIQAMLRGNQNGDLAQMLLDGAPFLSELTHTAVPQRAAAGTTATFTRATTAAVRDNEGVLRTAIAGEARFEGARRVRNLIGFITEDNTSGSYSVTGGSRTATTFTSTIGTDEIYTSAVIAAGGTSLNGRTFIFSVEMAAGTANSVYIGFEDSVSWAAGHGYQSPTPISLTTTPTRYSLAYTFTAATGTSLQLAVGPLAHQGQAAGNLPVGSITVTDWQIEEVTGRADQTTPSEYVSVGVPSDWIGTDLVSNGTFTTDTTGWTAVNSTLSSPATNLRITNVGANTGYAHQAITTVIGTKYVCSANITLGTSSNFGVYIGNSPGSGAVGGGSASATGQFAYEFTATATTTYISLINLQAVDARYSDFDNISVKPAIYHGAGVDGVKCFPTDLSGNPLPTAYTYDAVSLNGVAGTYVSTPDSVAASITGDIDIRCKVATADYSSGDQTLVAKWGAQASYMVRLNAAGSISANWSLDGSANVLTVSSAPAFVDGSLVWIRVTRVKTTGVVSFYTSSDGSTWTALGTDSAYAGSDLLDSTQIVEIGANGVGVNDRFSGKIYQAQIYNGINGTLAVDFDASRYAGGTTLTGSTGETWTLQGNAVIHPTNNPMLGYKPELAATNLCLQSNAFTTTWAALGSPSITQDAIGPDGATSAWTITDNQSGSYYGVSQTGVAFPSGGVGCASVFIKKKLASPAYPLVIFYHRVASVAEACGLIVNEVAGTAAVISGGGYVAPTAYAVESYNSDYWRVWLSKTQAGGTLTTKLELYPAGSTDGTTVSASGQGSTVFYGMQFEIGSFPTSYIATTTTAVTRNADILTYSGGDIPNLKTLMAGFRREVGVSSVGVVAELHDGTANEDTYMYLATATNIAAIGRDGGSTVLQTLSTTVPTNTYVPGTQGKYAVSTGALAADKRASDQGATAVMNIASAGVGTVTTLGVGCYNTGAFQLNGNVGPIYGWTRNQSQSELNAVTA